MPTCIGVDEYQHINQMLGTAFLSGCGIILSLRVVRKQCTDALLDHMRTMKAHVVHCFLDMIYVNETVWVGLAIGGVVAVTSTYK